MAPQATAVTSATPQYPAGGGSSSALEGFFGVAPVAQQGQPATHIVDTVAAGSTTTVFVNTTLDGGVGSSAYTVGDIVAALKAYGLLAL